MGKRAFLKFSKRLVIEADQTMMLDLDIDIYSESATLTDAQLEKQDITDIVTFSTN